MQATKSIIRRPRLWFIVSLCAILGLIVIGPGCSVSSHSFYGYRGDRGYHHRYDHGPGCGCWRCRGYGGGHHGGRGRHH